MRFTAIHNTPSNEAPLPQPGLSFPQSAVAARGLVLRRGISDTGPGRIARDAARNLRDAADGWVGLALLCLLAAALRWHDIALDGYWKNELFSQYWIRQSYAFLATGGLFQETNPPLHFLLLKLWTNWFGDTEFAARSLSALVSLACIPLIDAVGRELGGRELGGRRIGRIAAALLAICPVQIYFAHEARGYALLPAFTLLAMLGAGRFLRNRPEGLWYYGAGCIGLAFTHATGLIVMTALALAVLLAAIDTPPAGTGPGRYARLRRFVAANLVVGLLVSPVALAMVMQSGSANLDWMPRFGLDTMISINRYLLIGPMVRTDLGEAGSRHELLFEMGLATLTCIALFVTACRQIADRRIRALVLLFPMAFMLIIGGISLVRPILIPRVTIWISPAICLAVAAILARPTGWLGKIVPAGLFACCVAVGLWNNVISPAQHKPDWAGLLRDNPPDIADGPLLVAGPHAGPLGVAFYSKGPINRPLRHWQPQPDQVLTLADHLERDQSGATPIDTDELMALVRQGTHVRLYLDDDDEILITRHLTDRPEFPSAVRRRYPGLTVFSW